MPLCSRCGRRPRKAYRRLALPVDVVVRYDTRERRSFDAGEVFCIRCTHAVLPAYRGLVDGEEVASSLVQPWLYVTASGRGVFAPAD